MKKLACLLFLASVAVGQTSAPVVEPIKFRGAYLGEPLSDYVDCSSGKAKSLREGYKTHGKLCEGKSGMIARYKHSGFASSKRDAEIFSFEQSKLIQIQIVVPNDDWEKVRYDLVQKLGEPASEIPDVYQNGFGARYEFNRGFWSNGNVVVAAGIKVLNLWGEAIRSPSGQIATEGVEIKVMDAQRAKLPSTRASTID